MPFAAGSRPPATRPHFSRAVRAVLGRELLGLLRDRRALFSAIVLPVLLYPLLMWGNSWLERVSRETLAARMVTVALDLEEADPERARALRQLLGHELPIELVDVDTAELRELSTALHEGRPDALARERRAVRELLDRSGDALVTSRRHPVLASRSLLSVHYDGARETSQEAHRRIERVLTELERRERRERIERLLGDADPARGLDLEVLDIASAEDTSGAALGKLLPVLAVLVLVSGAAFAALSAFAGERENGTLETLLVQPTPALAIAWGKFLAVLILATAALASNLGSVLGSLALGLGSFPGLSGGESGALAVRSGRIALASLLFLPTVVLIGAVLCLVSARARSFREGQHLLLPLSIVAVVPALAAGQVDLEFDVLLALAPVFGPCLALRDALTGELTLAPSVVMLLASGGWAWLAVRRLADTLDAEKLLQGEVPVEELQQRHVQSRTALRWGVAAALSAYVVGGWLQSLRPLAGLMFTLWVLFPLLAWLAARGTARRAGESLRATLGLRLPRLPHALGAALCAPALAAFMRRAIEWQQSILPMPSSVLSQSESLSFVADLSPWALFFVLAVSPGVCEELMFRGAILSGLRRDLPPLRVAGWQALLFGLTHASIYRFLPTATIGALLALLTLRARSLWPAVLLHVGYNGLLVLSHEAPRLAWLCDDRLALLALPGLALLAVRPPGEPHPTTAPNRPG